MFRLFPILLILCVALLGVRIADMVDRQQSIASVLFIAPTNAEEAKKEEPKKEEKKEGEGKDEAKKDEHGAAKEGEKKEGEAAHDGSAPKEGEAIGDTAKPPPPKDEKRYTETEIDILQRLSERHKKLEQWQKEMEIRESVLKLTEEKVDQKLVELRELKTNVEALLAQYNEKEDAKIKSLVKIYENMKPKDAARIFDELDNEILLQVIDKMKEAKSAPILAKMTPEKAKEITTQLAEQRRLKAPDNSL